MNANILSLTHYMYVAQNKKIKENFNICIKPIQRKDFWRGHFNMKGYTGRHVHIQYRVNVANCGKKDNWHTYGLTDVGDNCECVLKLLLFFCSAVAIVSVAAKIIIETAQKL